MWSEQGELEGEPLTLDLARQRGSGQYGSVLGLLDEQMRRGMVKGQAITDYPIATDSGDVYFYSPEVLDQPENGVDGARNLYFYREGQIQLVTTLSVDGTGAVRRIQVSPDGSHAAFVTERSSPATKTKTSSRCTHSSRLRVRSNACPASRAASLRRRMSKRVSPASSCPTTAGHSSRRQMPLSRKTPMKAPMYMSSSRAGRS